MHVLSMYSSLNIDFIIIIIIIIILIMFNLFRIALWPSVGKELSPWLFICVVFILVPS